MIFSLFGIDISVPSGVEFDDGNENHWKRIHVGDACFVDVLVSIIAFEMMGSIHLRIELNSFFLFFSMMKCVINDDDGDDDDEDGNGMN